MGSLLPQAVVTVESPPKDAPPPIFPEEAMLIAGARLARREEFATTRACAREALARLGIQAMPILSGMRREPLWPDTVVGSLTHCPSYRAAAVAHRGEIVALGIDAEPHIELPAGTEAVIACRAEIEALNGLPEGVWWQHVLFSAKESVFKAWYPARKEWLDFRDVVVDFTPTSETEGTFRATIIAENSTVPDAFRAPSGRYAIGNGLILTAVIIPANPNVS